MMLYFKQRQLCCISLFYGFSFIVLVHYDKQIKTISQQKMKHVFMLNKKTLYFIITVKLPF